MWESFYSYFVWISIWSQYNLFVSIQSISVIWSAKCITYFSYFFYNKYISTESKHFVERIHISLWSFYSEITHNQRKTFSNFNIRKRVCWLQASLHFYCWCHYFIYFFLWRFPNGKQIFIYDFVGVFFSLIFTFP